MITKEFVHIRSGVRLEVLISGRDPKISSKPCLLFLHGLGCGTSANSWTFQLEEFEKDYFVVAPSVYGFGESIISHEVDISLPMLVEDQLTLLRHYKVSKFVVIAHAFQCTTALAIAQQFVNPKMESKLNPLDLLGIVLINGTEWSSWEVKLLSWISWAIPNWLYPYLYYRYNTPEQLFLEDQMNELTLKFVGKTTDTLIVKKLKAYVSVGNCYSLENMKTIELNPPKLIIQSEGKISQPTRFLFGGGAPNDSIYQSQWFPNASRSFFKESNQCPFLESPKEFNKVLQEFLERKLDLP